MRRALLILLTITLINSLLFSKGEAKKASDCPTASCLYLPIIGNPPTVIVYEVYQTITRAGTFRFTGSVSASKPVYNVIVEVREADGAFAISWPVVLKASLPGQLNPFDIGTNIDSYYNPMIEARVIDWKESGNHIYRNVTIISVSYRQNDIGTGVTAILRNDEAKPLRDVNGVIWGLDQDTGIVSVDIADSLAPGETITFSASLLGAYNLDYVHVSAQGIFQP